MRSKSGLLAATTRFSVRKLSSTVVRLPAGVAPALLAAVLVLAAAAAVAGPSLVGQHNHGPHLTAQRVKETASDPPG
jgi:predicted PurR-regulated permease PerM